MAEAGAEVGRHGGAAIEQVGNGGAGYADVLGEPGCGDVAEELLRQKQILHFGQDDKDVLVQGAYAGFV